MPVNAGVLGLYRTSVTPVVVVVLLLSVVLSVVVIAVAIHHEHEYSSNSRFASFRVWIWHLSLWMASRATKFGFHHVMCGRVVSCGVVWCRVGDESVSVLVRVEW